MSDRGRLIKNIYRAHAHTWGTYPMNILEPLADKLDEVDRIKSRIDKIKFEKEEARTSYLETIAALNQELDDVQDNCNHYLTHTSRDGEPYCNICGALIV